MSKVDPTWSPEQVAHALCDILVAKGQLKEKPAFIRGDREAKIAQIFADAGIDGGKMLSYDNPGPIEMIIRKQTNGEAWVQQVLDAAISMLPENIAKSAKKMDMDENTKEELAAAKEKSAVRRERLHENDDRDGGDTFKGGGKGRKGGKGGYADRDDRDDDRGRMRNGWDDDGGKGGGKRGKGMSEMECFNCGGIGHAARDCPEPPKDKKGKGKGSRRDMVCHNCGQPGHRSRDCPEPPDEEKVKERLAARAAAQAKQRDDDD